MDDPVLTADDLRAAWMDATRAAELAERLAGVARDAADHADAEALATSEVALLAESAADAAARAAVTARAAASEASEASAWRHDEPVLDVVPRSAAAAVHPARAAAHGVVAVR